ncbi:TetR/AcrR family transcriptional regulator [Agromyces endophyticus]|uniref:TetR/AcrR family transcriptional regulator n=1 Tax=Agromyces sp. H17E-10 TaxID=2932244 RepID=UPI001FD0359C|nr:TetR/AcrR family transcriptional regulator [Agromyces sp. H17E-10]UOQ90508.1 TetR/AcrR family transcriptional regulator [Agromyces sp. H17E-10]
MVTTTSPKRADARRNIESIVDAATRLLAADPDASVQDIAKAAGVGRVTLYGHFDSRATLVAEVATRAIAETDAALREVDLGGEPGDAMVRWIDATWLLTHRFGGIVVAAVDVLPAEQVRLAHEVPERRVRDLLSRGRDAGVFRSDLPVEWQIATIHALLHAASTECQRGALTADEAARLVRETILATLHVCR